MMEPDNPLINKDSKNLDQEPNLIPKTNSNNLKSFGKPLSKSAMKKFFRFLILANQRLRKENKPLEAHHVSFTDIKSKLENIKEKINETETSKKSPKRRRSHRHAKVTVTLDDNTKKSDKIDRSTLSKEVLKKIDKFGKKEIKHIRPKVQPKPKLKRIPADSDFEKRSREILDLKSVIFDLEKKHKELMEKDEHHPLFLKRLEEKINFLKKRISDIEDGR